MAQRCVNTLGRGLPNEEVDVADSTVTERRCTICGATKPASEFGKNTLGHGGLKSRCKECLNELSRADYIRTGGERQRRSALKNRYGLTPDSFAALLASQGGVCAICQGPPGKRGWVVDHKAGTNVARGILCNSCNVAIGLLKEDPEVLQAAISYLSREEVTHGN